MRPDDRHNARGQRRIVEIRIRFDGAEAAEGGSGCSCVSEIRGATSGGFHNAGGWGGTAQSGAGTACSGVDDAVDDCALKADLLRLLASIGIEKGSVSV